MLPPFVLLFFFFFFFFVDRPSPELHRVFTGALLEAARSRAGLGLEAAAEAVRRRGLKLSRPTLNRYERATSAVSLELFDCLAEVYYLDGLRLHSLLAEASRSRKAEFEAALGAVDRHGELVTLFRSILDPTDGTAKKLRDPGTEEPGEFRYDEVPAPPGLIAAEPRASHRAGASQVDPSGISREAVIASRRRLAGDGSVLAEVLPIDDDPTSTLGAIASEALGVNLSGPILWLTWSEQGADHGQGTLLERHRELRVSRLRPSTTSAPGQVVVASVGQLRRHLDLQPLGFDPALLLIDGFRAGCAAGKLDGFGELLGRTPTIALGSPLDGESAAKFLPGLPVNRRDDLRTAFADRELAPFEVWLIETELAAVPDREERKGPGVLADGIAHLDVLDAIADPRLPPVVGRSVWFCRSAPHLRLVADALAAAGRHAAVLDASTFGPKRGAELARLEADPAGVLCLLRGLNRFDPVPPVAQVVFLAPSRRGLLEARLIPLLRASRGGTAVRVVEFVEPGNPKRARAWKRIAAEAGAAGRVRVLPVLG